MKKTLFRQAMAIIALGLLSMPAAQAASVSMTTIGETNPPIGHYEFCKSHKDQCRFVGRDKGPMALDDSEWQTMMKVNYSVNGSIQPLTDREIYGVEERWSYPTTVGDCEDYVLLKRKMLLEDGFSPANLLITVVLQPNGDGHAVLTVRTNRGDFVLDNMRNKILLWSQTGYTFLKRQSSENSGRWVKLDAGRDVAVGSVQQ